jgi:tetratricopeptide (TPR) repeat protein
MYAVASYASLGSKTFKEGKALYDQAKYEEAITLFKQCIVENQKDYGAKGNYMIALCYKKLDRCSKAGMYFKLALSMDADKGGASSMDKFEEQLEACNLTKASLDNISVTEEENKPLEQPTNVKKVEEKPLVVEPTEKKERTSVVLWVIAGILMFVGLSTTFFYVIKKKKEQVELQAMDDSGTDDLYKISNVVFNESLWTNLASQFGQDKVDRLRLDWQEEYAHLVENKNPIGIREMMRKIKTLEVNPQKVFTENEA